MNKKYQVFVSSTYVDLIEERKEVIQALLELDSIPVGMKLFPAADDDQWTLIKNLIDDCDYYILILGGRYGSQHPTQDISYTQMEYEYALEAGIPIISFVHKNPENLPVSKTDIDEKKKMKLDSFKRLVQQKMCKFWETPVELGSVVSRSLVKLIKTKPRTGWVKADLVPSKDINEEILELKKENDRLKLEIEQQRSKPPEGIEKLKQGKDIYQIEYSYKLQPSDSFLIVDDIVKQDAFKISWDEIFCYLSPHMIDEANEITLKHALEGIIQAQNGDRIIKENNTFFVKSVSISDVSFQRIKVQLRALGLISKSIKKRSLKDNYTYWKLAPYGDNYMTRLIAIK